MNIAKHGKREKKERKERIIYKGRRELTTAR